MNDLLILGTRIVIVALIAYSIAIITEQRKKKITNVVFIFISLGILLDIASTALMIMGSSNSPFTLHGILGYSSLTAMLIDAFLMWRHRFTKGPFVEVSRKLHLFSRIAYIWWLAAFVTGGLIAIIKYL